MNEPTPVEWTFGSRTTASLQHGLRDKLFGFSSGCTRRRSSPVPVSEFASVRRIVGRHGGRTWAEGVHDQGSKFFFHCRAIKTRVEVAQ